MSYLGLQDLGVPFGEETPNPISGITSPAPSIPWSQSVFQDLCQAVCSSPRPSHQKAGELSLGGVLYPLQDKGGSQVRGGRNSPHLKYIQIPLDPGIWAPIPSTSSHHHQSGGGEQGCQFQSLRREESQGHGHLPSAFARDSREPHLPGVPGVNAGFCLIPVLRLMGIVLFLSTLGGAIF